MIWEGVVLVVLSMVSKFWRMRLVWLLKRLLDCFDWFFGLIGSWLEIWMNLFVWVVWL